MAIAADRFVDQLAELGVHCVAGVPDSVLQALGIALARDGSPVRHRVACNEGAAVGMAIGHHLATGEVPAVYMQNSGLGNAVNPLVSIAAADVYAIPMLLLVGWRGEIDVAGSQVVDEPQHALQGKVTRGQLDLLAIRHEVVGADVDDVRPVLQRLLRHAIDRREPVALVFRRNAFSAGAELPARARAASRAMTREHAIEACLRAIPRGTVTVTTTGMAARELFALRDKRGESHDFDFLVVGAMGHASHIALGIAGSRQGCAVVCLDGDGAALMHLGALPTCARAPGLVHVVLNNDAHESVGGQHTCVPGLRFAKLARACGYAKVFTVRSAQALEAIVADAVDGTGNCFIEVICRVGHRADLGRPTVRPGVAKEQFMRALRGESGDH